MTFLFECLSISTGYQLNIKPFENNANNANFESPCKCIILHVLLENFQLTLISSVIKILVKLFQ